MNLQEDIAAFVNVLGLDNPDVIFPLANLGWKSSDDRNKFIGELIKINNGNKIGSE